MKKIRLLIAVALSFALASTGSIYAMEDEDSGGSSKYKKFLTSSSVDQVSLLEWVESKDNALGDWLRGTNFGTKCTFGAGLAGLYAAHPHATKVVIAATFVYGVYWLYKKHNRRRKDREEWADED